MKVKKLAILLVVTFLTLETARTMNALADPTEMDNEVSQTPNEESKTTDEKPQEPKRDVLKFHDWRIRYIGKKPKNIWYKSTLTN